MLRSFLLGTLRDYSETLFVQPSDTAYFYKAMKLETGLCSSFYDLSGTFTIFLFLKVLSQGK